jgi:uncharacterized membrane protein YdjX (TVP38/TMEM64 family)
MIDTNKSEALKNGPPAVTATINLQFILKSLLFIALMAIGAYLFFHYDLYTYFIYKKKAIAFIKSYHPYDEVVFIFFQILQVLLAPIPGEVTGIIGGFIYGPLLGTLYSTIGLTIGSWLAFFIARVFGLPLVEKVVKREMIQKYDYLMEHKGVLVSFFLFLIPGFPKDFLCYIMGLSHMRAWTFLAISTVGRLSGTAMLSVSGSYAQKSQYGVLMLILAVSGVFVLLAYLYRDKLLETLRKRKNSATPAPELLSQGPAELTPSSRNRRPEEQE